MKFAVVVGSTETATIEGISAAGAVPEATYHTPAADLEIVEYGKPVFAPQMPVSPTGCPTPALITRAVRELVSFDTVAVESGLVTESATPTVTVGDKPGADIRSNKPVPDATERFERARAVGRALNDEELIIGESIPGGTTTALGVLTALGEPYNVSSSLPENPIERKQELVNAGLEASSIEAGALAGEPLKAITLMGDPVLPAVLGLTVGANERGIDVMLAGGTQMVTAGALARHFGVQDELRVATTVFVADDTPELHQASDELAFDLTVTDPGFDQSSHDALTGFCRGEAKEGVGMGGALALADRNGVSDKELRQQIVRRYEAVTDGP
ncbi:nicotinate mononucleotide-dependent phosphoribosyltransferase CobT [Halovenus rubra]|uniref:Nicotinate mononucleotide-dependent phosphoribosyltransferase CobT n=2 Tax=Halovenus rubra TaxID=869890 RepID=A0ACC7E5R7_9EURY|nr:TIGR00303 family protein [Halovenus rubra]